ncbi:MAG: phosphoribosylamine--glycine ligase [Oscillospiraceae bacterium]|nr:phosphoribosylamine--glycine ligase [Oscillospiraceae bacterium]
MNKILVIGGGGREHAICAALKKSPKPLTLYCAPGNGGISQIAECFPSVKATDIDGAVDLAKRIGADYVFVAPDDPLTLGMVDAMEAAGIKAFGARKNAAVIEGSKSFSKALMKKYNIPTAEYAEFDSESIESALNYIKTQNKYPAVIKCDGLALGKGVIIAKDFAQAETAVKDILLNGKFGVSGKKIIIEEYMTGPEVTVLAFSDGQTVVPMVSATDHKRALDDDKGLNTGGMGAIAPTPYYTKQWENECLEKIIRPTINAMRAEGRAFKGVLYFQIMLTDNGARVIEYNCRFGDPEAQTVLPLLKTDLFDIMTAVIEERLDGIKIEFSKEYSACVVMASGGYPENYNTGFEIKGLEKVSDAIIYSSGTKTRGEELITAGGRVLSVTALGETLDKAIEKAYTEIGKISFEGGFYRKDIGKKAQNYVRA